MQDLPNNFQPDQCLVEMTNISKRFGASIALTGVSLKLFPGSVHALMGENGAGKSTLMKILAGVHQADEGTILISGHKLEVQNPKQAQDAGVSTVFQELSLLPNLSIAENMFLGREPLKRFGLIDRKTMVMETATALRELNLNLDPSTLVSELTIAERQFVEIAHGIKADANVFILDEPTAALNAADVKVLNAQIQRLKANGKAIIYISHRMDEIFNVCDTVTVLKDGQHIETRSLDGMTTSGLIALMVGRDIDDLFPKRNDKPGAPILVVDGLQLSAKSPPINLTLHRGEILGLAGLEGQGQQALVRSLIGAFKPVVGEVRVRDISLKLPLSERGGVRRMQRLGVGFVPEDRKDEGLYLGLPISHNIAMGLHTSRNDFAPALGYRSQVAEAIASMRIKTANSRSTAGSLSGGNQQKVLLGRYLASDVEILLIEEPTRGVDIGSKSEIYDLLRSFTNKGGAVLVLSRETIELIGLTDRILVVHDQAIVSEMPASEATEHGILDVALNSQPLSKKVGLA